MYSGITQRCLEDNASDLTESSTAMINKRNIIVNVKVNITVQRFEKEIIHNARIVIIYISFNLASKTYIVKCKMRSMLRTLSKKKS